MPLPTSPVIRRARLGAELRQLRRRESLTLEQVCDRLGWASTSKLSRIELGQSRPDLADVLDLLDVYKVPTPAREALIVIARDAATSRGWWKTLGEMSERQRTYAELEAGPPTSSSTSRRWCRGCSRRPRTPGCWSRPASSSRRTSTWRPRCAPGRCGRRCCGGPTRRATWRCSPRLSAIRVTCRWRSGVNSCVTWSP